MSRRGSVPVPRIQRYVSFGDGPDDAVEVEGLLVRLEPGQYKHDNLVFILKDGREVIANGSTDLDGRFGPEHIGLHHTITYIGKRIPAAAHP